ncbi:unnamed protein product [Schistosoma turkestanicum]|nr:unnamed protein product [Schistosoma turkestanicum]
MFASECEKFLAKLHNLPATATQELSVLGVINEAFACPSAHVRSGCLDVLAGWNSPQICLNAGSAGEVVLWHTGDGDPRVRDRAFHCLLTWLCTLNAVLKSNEFNRSGKAKYINNHKETGWFETNLESVYSAACQGLLDSEELVRRTSLHVLGKLSTIWPHHNITDAPVFNLNSLISSKRCLDSDLDEIQLVDDAFIRVCCRLQDPSRSVRQLAAQIMADLAKFVTENCLLQTLEKTVMTDRQVRRYMMENDVKSKNKSKNKNSNTTNNNNPHSTMDNRTQATKHVNSDSINLISTGCNGAIISGLEDDYFEIRCTTLATLTHIASLNTRFALNCQDLLVDMLTDDIQDVRLAAVRALSVVGDKVPVKSEQVAIITSALAEGSGRIRRRLHHLLSQCRLASAPCLISLLDGLLQNLRRYPEDRDNLWRCAASVGKNHPIFVEMCLSSLLRTHSWLNGPEPIKEDPAYLTVLLLVFNAEPNVPGMLAKFPRHVTSTKIYLQELLPSLLPKTAVSDEFQSISPWDLPNKKLCMNIDTALNKYITSSSSLSMEHGSLYQFIAATIYRICKLFTMIHHELLSYSISSYETAIIKQNHLDTKSNSINLRLPSYKYQSHRYTLLSHLIYHDLIHCIKKLNSNEQLKNLLYWLHLITMIGWYLLSAHFMHQFHSLSSPPTSTVADVHSPWTNHVEQNRTSTTPTTTTTTHHSIIDERIVKLLSKALRNSLKINHLFSGKTNSESRYTLELCSNIFNLVNLFNNHHHQFNVQYLLNALQSIINLLSNSNSNQQNGKATFSSHSTLTSSSLSTHHPTASVILNNNRKRSFPTELNIDHGDDADDDDADEYVRMIDYLIDLSKRLIPVYAVLLQPANNTNNPASQMDTRSIISLNNYYHHPSNDHLMMKVNDNDLSTSSSSNQINGNIVIPEIRFTAIIASAMIRIRAIIVGLNIEAAR